jgi:acyl carrier protein
MILYEEVKGIIAEILELPIDNLDSSMEMQDIPEWDSMRNVIILSTLEEHFGVVFPDDDIFDLVSVDAYVAEIEKLKM